LPVTLYSYTGSGATLQVDWVYIRLYRDPEPTVTVGEEQGLVALSIELSDSPDPIRSGQRLTYLLTILNEGQINAPSVVVTDTLPENVQIGPVTTSQGSCEPNSIVLCDLNTLNTGSTAWVTIVVTPTMDGVITDTAKVGSLGYELDLQDNTTNQTTLVDSVPPLVNWERPVQNGGIYRSLGGLVTLEASATDDDQVAWVEFRLWDHLWNNHQGRWVIIGTDSTYPYQVPFDSDILVVGELYQMFVLASDRAGNVSNPYNPLRVIYIAREIPLYLPLVSRQ
jgi:uncharacterized repeat protein (TIGR01451 family)